MRLFTLLFSFCLSLVSLNFEAQNNSVKKNPDPVLHKAFQNKFYIGTALNAYQVLGQAPQEMEVVKQHFNSIVAENCMKSGRIQPRKGEFDFSLSDVFVEFGERNNMHIHGHTLIWHSQAPQWFFVDEEGETVSREVLVQRMKDHIYTVVGRYKGKVDSWDVVNEAILDDGSFRESEFYNIIGEDFIRLAFKFAHEADPEAQLFYNDYSMSNPGKRRGVVKMVQKLKEEGTVIHGIGMQGHIGLNHPDIKEFEQSLEAFGALGKVVISELDLSVLPSSWGDAGANISENFEYEDEMNPFKEELPATVEAQFNERYTAFFKLFLKHQDVISRVTLWGLNDGNSWKNNWPVRGRTDYPLLFNRENKPKSVIKDIIKLTKTR
jgi:endo-1,4-beta-xylanase